MAHLRLPAIWPSGSRAKTWSIYAEHRIIPKLRERSSAGNRVRYHESINNLSPADVYFGRAETILAERERIKRATIAKRRLQHQLQAAQTLTLMSQSLPSRNA